MKNLLYIGNRLVSEKTNITTIDTLGNLLSAEGYNVEYASSKHNKLLRLVDMLLTVLKFRKSTDYVLIDTYSTQNFYYAYSVGKLCRSLKIPYVPILHGGDLPSRLKRSPRKSRSLFDHAHKNIAPSMYIKNAFESNGFNNIEHIPNSIEITQYPFKERSAIGPRVFWLRSFKEIYNPTMAIKVMRALKEMGIEPSLCMIGPKGDHTYEETMKLCEGANFEVKILGKRDRQEWIDISEEYDIFLNTSNFDNMPVSLIEAMALGMPVVTTDVGGIPSIVAHMKEAVLIGKDDHEAAAMAIKQLLESPSSVRDMTTNARHKAEEYNWSAVKEKWHIVLK